MFRKDYERRLDQLVKASDIALKKELESSRADAQAHQAEMEQVKDNAQAEYVAIKVQSRNAEVIVNDMKLLSGNVVAVNYASGNGPNDEQDNGVLSTRKLIFEKLSNETILRLNYVDNTRAVGTNSACRWSAKQRKLRRY